ncbi:MAG: methyltransferase domain-containing protein [Rhodospirillales bacterium]|nr:methyltransferase domain-containing protein [Rhodospirillales bacterium]
MKECSKAVMRRLHDPNFANRYFVGSGVDIGGAPDPLGLYVELFPRMRGVATFDKEQGDAEVLESLEDCSQDFVHSSHCLEHMNDPAAAIQNWFRVVKQEGHLIVTVPDEDLYEQGRFPSTWNGDHKHTFTIFKARSWSDKSVNLLELIMGLGAAAELVRLSVLDEGFRHTLPRFDQTMTPIGECGIEFVIRKRSAAEMEAGGRVPPAGVVSKMEAYLLTGFTFD